MRQAGDVPQGELVESIGRCWDRQRSQEVKLFHYERTRVVFIHSPFHLGRGGLGAGNGDGYLTLEAKKKKRLATNPALFLSSGVEIRQLFPPYTH